MHSGARSIFLAFPARPCHWLAGGPALQPDVDGFLAPFYRSARSGSTQWPYGTSHQEPATGGWQIAPMAPDSIQPEILFERRGAAGIVLLNRPQTLNASTS